jgi:pimeloyl-ACP methyl ester carboxylesterase
VGELAGRADIVVFEPPGTGASSPARGFEFTLDAFARVGAELLEAVGPRTLIFPCYLGFVAQALARRQPLLVERVVLPQVPSWGDLARWADGVDPNRVIRTPLVGQALVTVSRRRLAKRWYAASTGDRRFREPFQRAADEAFGAGGCFCLASIMQGLERSEAPEAGRLPVLTAVLWGTRDRTHRRSKLEVSVPGADLIRFEGCGHSPELEAPARFAEWVLSWHEAAQ